MSDAAVPPPNDREDDLLDALIRRVCREEADPAAVERLSRAWQREMDRGRRRPMWVPLAAAACLAVLAGTLALMALGPRGVAERGVEPGLRSSEDSSDATEDKMDPANAAGHVEDRDERPEDPVLHTAGVSSEPPAQSPYERLLAEAALQRRAAGTDLNVVGVRRRLIEHLKRLERIDERTADELAVGLGLGEAKLEAELARLSLALRGPHREKAIELFGRMATSGESLATLVQLWKQGGPLEHVAPALARLADAQTLAACYRQAASPEVRRVLAEALVERLGNGDGRLLVNFLAHERRPEELLTAIRRANGPLTESLFAELASESRAIRYAAARALGALNDPEISRRLIHHIVSGHLRQEALVALAASREPTAVAFLSQARGNAVLATALQSALVQSTTSHEWYGG